MAKKKLVKQPKKLKSTKKSIKALYQLIAIVAILALIVFLVFPDLFKKESPLDEYPFKKEGELTFYTKNNEKIVTIDIEIADSDYERQLGLMKRKKMDDDQGMLFIFPLERIQSFWMLNTLISLDMIFVNSKKEIVTIHKNTTPLVDRSYPSSSPAIYVIEVIAGFTDKYNIDEGDRISWMGTKL